MLRVNARVQDLGQAGPEGPESFTRTCRSLPAQGVHPGLAREACARPRTRSWPRRSVGKATIPACQCPMHSSRVMTTDPGSSECAIASFQDLRLSADRFMRDGQGLVGLGLVRVHVQRLEQAPIGRNNYFQ